MKIRAGYEIAFGVPKPTPMILMLTVHPSRINDVLTRHELVTVPSVPLRHYRDLFGNTCTRVVAPPGRIEFRTDFVIRDSGLPDEVCRGIPQTPIEQLPDDVLVYLIGSRYCDTQTLSDFAWRMFGATTPGWDRVQAICDFVHNQIRFDYDYSRSLNRDPSDAACAASGFPFRPRQLKNSAARNGSFAG
jgi:transglutaminase-like putative cysteine protease